MIYQPVQTKPDWGTSRDKWKCFCDIFFTDTQLEALTCVSADLTLYRCYNHNKTHNIKSLDVVVLMIKWMSHSLCSELCYSWLSFIHPQVYGSGSMSSWQEKPTRLIVTLLENWKALAKRRCTLLKNATTLWCFVLLLHEFKRTSTRPWTKRLPSVSFIVFSQWYEEKCELKVVYKKLIMVYRWNKNQTNDVVPDSCGFVISVLAGNKPIILVVMHHTFDPNHILPRGSGLETNPNVHLTVNCLFHENRFLQCASNDEAFRQVQRCLGVSQVMIQI